MNLKTERKIKFWLATISKILVIALVLFKLADYVFDEEKTDNTINNDALIDTSQNKEVADSIPKVDTDKIEKTKMQVVPAKSKTSEQKSSGAITQKATLTTAKLHLVDDSFVWLKDKHKFFLKLANSGAAAANDVTVNATLFYGKEQQTISVKQESSIDANGTVSLDFTSSNLLYTTLPKTILLCVAFNNANKQNHWCKYILGNKITGNGAIEMRSVYYKTLSVSNGTYSKTPPSCVLPKSIQNTSSTKNRNDDSVVLDKIKSSAQLFIRGLNSKSQITIKNTSTPKLYTTLNSIEASSYSYGFSADVEIVSHTKTEALVRLTLTEQGRENYIKQQATYQAQNSSKNSSHFFSFLRLKGNSWEGKLVNVNGIWKFDNY